MHQCVDYSLSHGINGEGFLVLAVSAVDPCHASHIASNEIGGTVDNSLIDKIALLGDNRR